MPSESFERDQQSHQLPMVLLTMPKERGERLKKSLAALAIQSALLPGITIAPLPLSIADQKILTTLSQFDKAFFVSPNAAKIALAYCETNAITPPKNLKIYTVGESTANFLRQHGWKVAGSPKEKSISEALLAIPQLAKIEGEQILILKGKGGRPLLADTLKARGARITPIDLYERGKPMMDVNEALAKIPTHLIKLGVITSVQALENIWSGLKKAHRLWFSRLPLLVISDRIKDYGKKLGHKGAMIVANGPSDEHIISTIKCALVNRGKNGSPDKK